MFTAWDIVRPRFWHPVASMEQSMMDFDELANQMMDEEQREQEGEKQEHRLETPSNEEEEDFFSDLPVRNQPLEETTTKSQNVQPEEDQQQNQKRTFSTYSYSSSSLVDENGKRIVSTRRRYEDSTGRLKAIHEREIAGKKLKSIWNRLSNDELGSHGMICTNGTPEDFEKIWSTTPFGKLHDQMMLNDSSNTPWSVEKEQ
jgi:hypothetical protein